MKYLNLNQWFKQLFYSFGALVFAVALLLASCDNSTNVDEPEPQIVDALIELDGSSDEATIEAGETVKFSGFALTESGDKIPLAELNENWSWDWQSTDTAVFTVDTEGNGTGKEEGDAFCVITLNGPDDGTESSSFKQGTSSVTASNPGPPEIHRPFVGRDSLFVGVRLN